MATTPKRTGKRWADILDTELVAASLGTDEHALLLSLNSPEKVFDTNDGDLMPDRKTPVLTLDSPRDAVRKTFKGSKRHQISTEPEGPELVQDVSNIDSTPARIAIDSPNRGGCSIETEQVISTLSPKITLEPKGRMEHGPATTTASSPMTPCHRAKDIAQKAFETEEIDSDDDFQVGIARPRPTHPILTIFTSDGHSEEEQNLREATAHFKPYFLGEVQHAKANSDKSSTAPIS
jgi:hypothetical protein